MTSGSTSSASTSERTSDNRPGETERRGAESESEFLARQANEAKSAIANVLERMKADAGKTVDPRLWTKEYPWTSVAAAAVGGFVAASLIVPSKEQQALKRLARIERALHPNGEQRDRKPAADRGIFGDILSSAIKSIQPILMSAISGAITGKMAQPDSAELKAAADSARPVSPTTHPDVS